MMRRVVRSSSQIKKAEAHLHLNGFVQGCCLEITQGHRKIYLLYRPSEDHNEKNVQINSKICELNDFADESNCSIKSVVCQQIDKLTIFVSHLDWQIVSHRYERYATQFLQQITYIWPQAKLPLYYSDHDYIVMEIRCEKICQVGINTLVQFIENGQRQFQKSEEEKTEISLQLVLDKEEQTLTLNGYLNQIMISYQNLERISGTRQDFPIFIQNLMLFQNCPSLTDLLTKTKQLESVKEQNKPIKKLVVLKGNDGICNQAYQCLSEVRQNLNLTQLIKVSNLENFLPFIECISFQILLKDKRYKIVVSEIIDGSNFFEQTKLEQEEQIKMKFIKLLHNKLEKQRQFYIFQTNSPLSLGKKLFNVWLNDDNNKTSRQSMNKIICIKNQSKCQQITSVELKSLTQKVQFVPFGLSIYKQPFILKEKYNQVSKWIQLVRLRESFVKNEQNQIKQFMLNHLFMTIYKPQVQKAQCFLKSLDLYQNILLITSFGSNGKTLMHKMLQKRGYRMWMIDMKELNKPGINFRDLDYYLKWVIANSPYQFIYFDNFDCLCARIEQSDQLKQKEKILSKVIVRKFLKYLKLFRKKFIITAKSQSAINEELQISLNIHTIIRLKNPSRELRQRSIVSWRNNVQLKKMPNNFQQKYLNHLNIQTIVNSTQSLSYGSFCSCILNNQLPVSKTNKKKYDFSKLAGMKTAKKTIKQLIEKPIKYSFLFKSVSIKLPRGILLYGASGNGKSAVGAALEDEFKMKYFNVKGSDIMSKYIGGSEAAVRDIFEKAMSVSPSIIFFDEFQSIVPKRNANNTGVNDRVVNQFLCYLDGVSSTAGVFIVAASSRPDMIDPALLRPGRLDAHLYLDYPNDQEKMELLKLFSQSIQIDISLQQLNKSMADFSYSDIIGLLKQLRIKRAAEVLKKSNYTSQDFIFISKQFYYEILGNYKQSSSKSDRQKQKRLFESFKNGEITDIKKQKQIQF